MYVYGSGYSSFPVQVLNCKGSTYTQISFLILEKFIFPNLEKLYYFQISFGK